MKWVFTKCKKCGGEIIPKYCADQIEVRIAGMTHYYLDDREISKDEARKLLSIIHPGQEPLIP